MFELLNINNRQVLTVRIKYKDETLEFVISSLINKRNKDELNNDVQFTVLNSYCDYKGEDFKAELFNRYKKADAKIMEYITITEIYPLPYEIAHRVLDMFDTDDLFTYLKQVIKLAPPAVLADQFDEQYEKDKLGSRVQTYLKDEYIELAAFATAIKAVLPIITQFGYIKKTEIMGMHKEYILFNFIKNHKLIKTPASIKLYGLINKLITKSSGDSELDAIRVIEKQLPRDELNNYIAAIVILQKISIATLIEDDSNRNIITRIYNYVNNKLKIKIDVGNRIRAKQSLQDSDTPGDKESILEAYRVTGLPAGTTIELDWSISNVDVIIPQINANIDRAVVNDALKFTSVFKDGIVTDTQILLLSYIFKRVIDPRGLEHVTIESIINLLSVGFGYLWSTGNKELALLLTAIPAPTSNTVMAINSTVNRNRIPKEVKDKLQEYYPYNRVVNATTTVNLAEEAINELSNDIFTKRWLSTASAKYTNEVLGGNLNKILPPDLKLKLANLIVQIEDEYISSKQTRNKI